MAPKRVRFDLTDEEIYEPQASSSNLGAQPTYPTAYPFPSPAHNSTRYSPPSLPPQLPAGTSSMGANYLKRSPPMVKPPNLSYPHEKLGLGSKRETDFDLSRHPYTQLIIDPDSAEGYDPAGTGSSKPMEILCELLPWKITVSPKHGAWVTVDDVFVQMYNSLQLTVTPQEVRKANPGDWQAVTKAWEKRDPDGREGVKRIDFLLGNFRFLGLTALEEEDYWRLHVGK